MNSFVIYIFGLFVYNKSNAAAVRKLSYTLYIAFYIENSLSILFLSLCSSTCLLKEIVYAWKSILLISWMHPETLIYKSKWNNIYIYTLVIHMCNNWVGLIHSLDFCSCLNLIMCVNFGAEDKFTVAYLHRTINRHIGPLYICCRRYKKSFKSSERYSWGS